jgi:hypothetical protein
MKFVIKETSVVSYIAMITDYIYNSTQRNVEELSNKWRSRRGGDRMIVGFTTICAIIVYPL